MSSIWPLEDCFSSLPLGKQRVRDWSSASELKNSWQLLDLHAEAVAANKSWDGNSPAQLDDGARISVGEGTKILPGVYVEGDVVIGKNCKIGPNCYLRGPISVGDDCHVGQAVELKNTILGDGVSVGHLSYVGDSILGPGVNFGAGTITSNLRHDGTNHATMVDGELVDTGRRKLGAIVGPNVHTGIHTSLYPGRKLGPDTTTLPGEVVSRDKH